MLQWHLEHGHSGEPYVRRPRPAVELGWRQRLATLTAKFLCHVSGTPPAATASPPPTETDVLFVYRRVIAWCNLLAVTSPALVRDKLPPGHALAAYVLLLARRSWSDGTGAAVSSILPADPVVSVLDADRCTRAFFVDPTLWTQHVELAMPVAHRHRGRKRGREDPDAADEHKRDAFRHDILDLHEDGGGGGGSGGAGTGTSQRSRTPYDHNEYVTPTQILTVAQHLVKTYERCRETPAWLRSFFRPWA